MFIRIVLSFLARSPFYTHLSATLAGLSTIRAFGLSNKVLQDFYGCLDYQMEGWFMFLDTRRWFGQRTDFIALVFNVFAVFAPVVAIKYTG